MREIESDERARAPRGARDAREIERLPRAELHTGPQHAARSPRRAVAEQRLDRGFVRTRSAPGAAPARSDPRCGSSPCHASCDATACRSEENAPASMRILRARAGGPVEAREHQVDVHGERVHRDDFARLRAGETAASPVREILVILDPRPPRRLRARARRASPSHRSSSFDQRARGERHADRANGRRDRSAPRRRVPRHCEARAERAQRIGLIARARA